MKIWQSTKQLETHIFIVDQIPLSSDMRTTQFFLFDSTQSQKVLIRLTTHNSLTKMDSNQLATQN